jgi:hypothetical protein
VLVFDATRQDSLALVQQWAAMSRADAAEVRLLVANKVDRLVEQPPPANGSAQPAPPPAPRRSPWLVAAQAWCSEHLYEYVEVRWRVRPRPPPQPQAPWCLSAPMHAHPETEATTKGHAVWPVHSVFVLPPTSPTVLGSPNLANIFACCMSCKVHAHWAQIELLP